jgi:flagellar motor switch protein FliM
MPESHGVMNVAFPAVASNALLRRLDQDGGYSRHRGPNATRQRMIEHALEFPFQFSLGMPPCKLPIRSLLDLTPGAIVPFSRRTDLPIEGTVASQPVYEAFPIRAGIMRASKISRMLPPSSRSSSEDAQEFS